ncbi:MAG: c-type cytochrome [Amphiplicatus sp.]
MGTIKEETLFRTFISDCTLEADSAPIKGAFRRIGRAARLIVLVGAAAALSLGCSAKDQSADAAAETQTIQKGDSALGLAYAKARCASCHAVEPEQAISPNPAAPTFSSLANRPDMTRMALSALLGMPHRNMPNLYVEPESIDDLAAYLSTLRNDHEPV